MRKPVMKSTHAFVDYLAEHLGMVRCLKSVSNQHPTLAALDERMGRRWSSVINGRSPSPQQRREALAERVNVADLRSLTVPGVDALLVRLHSLQMYVVALPAPAQAGTGWDVPAHVVHPRDIVSQINACVDTVKALRGIDPDDPTIADVWDQLMHIARWSRESLNPPADDRARITLGRLTATQLHESLDRLLYKFCVSFHDFCELYAQFPELAAPVAMDIGTTDDFHK